METAEDDVWKALSDPLRRAVLDALRDGPRTTGALAARFPQSRFGVAKHLRVLEGAGLITTEKRGRERWHHLNAPALRAATDRWLSAFQRGWADRLDALGAHLERETEMTHAPPLPLDIRVEVTLNAPPDRVFRALTDEVGAWWTAPYRQTGDGGALTLAAEIGAPLIEHGTGTHAAIWGHVEEIAPPRLLSLTGRFGVAGALAGQVRWEIAAEEQGRSHLTLTHKAVGAIAPETQGAFDAGWTELVTRRLPAHLGG